MLLQHEYGIYGGRDGEYVLSFVRELSQPLVVTLHTILSEPTSHQLEVLTALCAEAQRVIVMTETGRRLLAPRSAPARTRRSTSSRTVRRSSSGARAVSSTPAVGPAT